MDSYKAPMGKRIKKRRTELGYTQQQLAEILGISQKHLGEVERGIAGLSMENLLELCKTLGVDLNYLVMGETMLEAQVPSTWNDLYLRCPVQKRGFLLSLVEIAVRVGRERPFRVG